MSGSCATSATKFFLFFFSFLSFLPFLPFLPHSDLNFPLKPKVLPLFGIISFFMQNYICFPPERLLPHLLPSSATPSSPMSTYVVSYVVCCIFCYIFCSIFFLYLRLCPSVIAALRQIATARALLGVSIEEKWLGWTGLGWAGSLNP